MPSNAPHDSNLGFTGIALLVLSALIVGWLIAETLIPRTPLPRVPASLHDHSIARVSTSRLVLSDWDIAR